MTDIVLNTQANSAFFLILSNAMQTTFDILAYTNYKYQLTNYEFEKIKEIINYKFVHKISSND